MPPLHSSDSTDRCPWEGNPTFHSSNTAAAVISFQQVWYDYADIREKALHTLNASNSPEEWNDRLKYLISMSICQYNINEWCEPGRLFFFLFNSIHKELNQVIVLTSTTCATSITFAKSEFIPLCQIPPVSINYSKHIKVTISQKGDMFLVNPHLKIVPNGKHFGKKRGHTF